MQELVRNVRGFLLKPADSLSLRVVHASVWVLALRAFVRGLGLVRNVVLARLLAPDDFGLFGIAMLALSILDTFSRTGFDNAIIQRKEDSLVYLSVAWTVQMLRGALLALLLLVTAPAVEAFFGEPRVIPLVRVLGVAVFVRGLTNTGVIHFRKELEFHKQFAYQFSSAAADFLVAILGAVLFDSVWALVFGLLARNLVGVLVSYWIHSYRPSLVLDWEKTKDLLEFGRWVWGMNILGFLATEGDDVVLGRLLGTSALGFYQFAYNLSNSVATEITHVISGITFPAYSKIQGEIATLRTAFIRTLGVTVFLSFPVATAIFLLIPEFVDVFLGAKWRAIVGPVRILVIAGALRSVIATWGPLYMAKDLLRFAFAKNISRVVLTYAPIYFLTTRFGASGTSLCVVLGILAAFIYDIYYVETKDEIGLRTTEILKALLPALLGSALVCPVLIALKCWLEASLALFIVVVPVCTVVYLAAVFLFQSFFGFSPLRDLLALVKNVA